MIGYVGIVRSVERRSVTAKLWKGGLVVWEEKEICNISVAFTWKMGKALELKKKLECSGKEVRIGAGGCN